MMNLLLTEIASHDSNFVGNSSRIRSNHDYFAISILNTLKS